MNSMKCTGCGLINFSTHETCRRCGSALPPSSETLPDPPAGTDAAEAEPERHVGHSLLWIGGTTSTILVASFLSLLVTSDGLNADQRRMVTEAVAVVERAGFERESFALRRIVFYRSTDSWWNEYVGHQSAYAATNFPFAVVTLYPAFFRFPVDATERAAILFHEAHHVFGADEPTALQRVWLEKPRLGWTARQYSQTRVWKNTREWTIGVVPVLFQCGLDGKADCVE